MSRCFLYGRRRILIKQDKALHYANRREFRRKFPPFFHVYAEKRFFWLLLGWRSVYSENKSRQGGIVYGKMCYRTALVTGLCAIWLWRSERWIFYSGFVPAMRVRYTGGSREIVPIGTTRFAGYAARPRIPERVVQNAAFRHAAPGWPVGTRAV